MGNYSYDKKRFLRIQRQSLELIIPLASYYPRGIVIAQSQKYFTMLSIILSNFTPESHVCPEDNDELLP